MKLILKVILLLLLIPVSSIQAQIPNGNFMVNGRTFIGSPDTSTYSNGIRSLPGLMYVKLAVGSFNNTLTVNPIPDDCYKSVVLYERNKVKADFIRYFNILRTVFPASRCTTIFNSDNAIIGMIGIRSVFKITANGTVTDVFFMVSENTIITPQEIDLLYTRLIAQMSFTTSPVNCPVDARFVFPDELDFMEQFGVIHINPYYFGNGPRWVGR